MMEHLCLLEEKHLEPALNLKFIDVVTLYPFDCIEYPTKMHGSIFPSLVKVFTIFGYVASATKDVKVFKRWFPVIDDVIWCFFMSEDDKRSILGVVAIASSQKKSGSLEAESIVRTASTKVQFHLSTTPFCSGVRAMDV
ncbi:hypothetical protein Tco_1334177 [Tanacetum coccineum]